MNHYFKKYIKPEHQHQMYHLFNKVLLLNIKLILSIVSSRPSKIDPTN